MFFEEEGIVPDDKSLTGLEIRVEKGYMPGENDRSTGNG
jgi:hypothetical protein